MWYVAGEEFLDNPRGIDVFIDVPFSSIIFYSEYYFTGNAGRK